MPSTRHLYPGVGIGPNLGIQINDRDPGHSFYQVTVCLQKNFSDPDLQWSAWVAGEPISKFRYWVMQLAIILSQLRYYCQPDDHAI